MLTCRICSNSDSNISYTAREMMFGFRDEFEYFECAKCGCLQIAEFPQNISKYYPEDYYSFVNPDRVKNTSLQKFIKHQYAKYFLKDKSFIRSFFVNLNSLFVSSSKFKKLKKKIDFNILNVGYDYGFWLDWFRGINISFNSAVLDVGCGFGDILLHMNRFGFTNLRGIDPYLKEDIKYNDNVQIYKKSLRDVKEKYDLIMFNHSFEHIAEPFETLRDAYAVLKDSGCLMLRIPAVPCYAWNKYKTNWVQIDAPRHFFIYSPKSIEFLGRETGFEIRKVLYDSTILQFWGSEQYVKNIPLMSEESYLKNHSEALFTKDDMCHFEEKTIELNIDKSGDQACFYLFKTKK